MGYTLEMHGYCSDSLRVEVDASPKAGRGGTEAGLIAGGEDGAMNFKAEPERCWDEKVKFWSSVSIGSSKAAPLGSQAEEKVDPRHRER